MAIAHRGSNIRSLLTLLRSVCSGWDFLPSSSGPASPSSSSLLASACASAKRPDWSSLDLRDGSARRQDVLGNVSDGCKQEAGSAQDGDISRGCCSHGDLLSGSSSRVIRATGLAGSSSIQESLPSEVLYTSTLSPERLPWKPHPPWKKEALPSYQAHQFRLISTSCLENHPASPDFSPGISGLDQDKLDPFALVADDLAQLGHKLRAMVAAEIPKLAEAAEYFFKMGVEGKRFRPMVLLLMASSLTAEGTAQHPAVCSQRERQQQIAEITEMIHVASLLHDDVLDEADTRRGIGSLNHVMGNKLAVLAGDFLLARASVALASLRNTEVMELLSKVLEHLVTGEIMQLSTETQQICSMEYYMQKTFYKTASLMANSCKSIALLAEQPSEVADLAFEYGRHLGLAFQLVDDSLDFVGTKVSLGKPTLSDLTQGIATAPVLFALEEHPQIYDLVNRKFRRTGDVEQALEMVRNSQGILKTRQLAAHHAHQAALAIAGLPPSSCDRAQLCRRALTELTEQVITRTK